MERSNSKDAVQVLKKICIIIFLVFMIDRGVGLILKYFYFHQEYGESSRTTYVIDSTLADIIILGSSRANHGYVPEVFEETISYTCYNAGRAGCFFLFNYATFKAITERYDPKLIIFDIIPTDLSYNRIGYERLSLLLPYCQQHPEIERIINLRGPLEKVKQISAIYPYNSFILQAFAGNIELKNKRFATNNGFISHSETMGNHEIDTLIITPDTLDDNIINALKDIILTCHRKNIDLAFVYSPVWRVIEDVYYDQNLI